MSKFYQKLLAVLFVSFSIAVLSCLLFNLDHSKKQVKNVDVLNEKKAQVALVVDDFGQYNREGIKEFLALDIPLTCAVMPNLSYSRQDAIAAAHSGHEVIVHLPMEPVNGKPSWLGPGGITAKMTKGEIAKQVAKNFAQIPYAVGFNNHMGSLITSKEKMLKPILEVAKAKGYFVLDSLTTPNSKVVPLAQKLNLAYAQRDVFLDDVKNKIEIKKQLELLAEIAQLKGSAIGICHVGIGSKITSEIIKQMVPTFEKEGIKFVYLSELVH
ncbi:divergent polysaccharide deacetylase family protein [Bacillota bacterium LX-D]|nr:divergent polysaccharide deacetylase family protein [Bacillota bacterium LX-D]